MRASSFFAFSFQLLLALQLPVLTIPRPPLVPAAVAVDAITASETRAMIAMNALRMSNLLRSLERRDADRNGLRGNGGRRSGRRGDRRGDRRAEEAGARLRDLCACGRREGGSGHERRDSGDGELVQLGSFLDGS